MNNYRFIIAACGCNIHGSMRDDCEQMTGRCMCRPGITGQRCNICPNGKFLGPTGCSGNDPFHVVTYDPLTLSH